MESVTLKVTINPVAEDSHQCSYCVNIALTNNLIQLFNECKAPIEEGYVPFGVGNISLERRKLFKHIFGVIPSSLYIFFCDEIPPLYFENRRDLDAFLNEYNQKMPDMIQAIYAANRNGETHTIQIKKGGKNRD